MSTDGHPPRNGTASNDAINPAWIEAIARQVVTRLMQAKSRRTVSQPSDPTKATSNTNTTLSIDDRIITAETIGKLDPAPAQLRIGAAAVVTPAARDEARHRGIAIERGSKAGPLASPPTQHENVQVHDSLVAARASAVQTQLDRRGISPGDAAILLSDAPARDVYRRCAEGDIAVMITSLSDVARFSAELSPNVWVLDMKRLNIPMAVNVIAEISKADKASK